MNGYNLFIFQGDIYNIPLTEKLFDKVLCLGVLQHTPDPELAFKNLVKYVKTNGELVIDVYRADFLSLIQWKYFLRPLTKHVNQTRLYNFLNLIVPLLVPFTSLIKRVFGRGGARISPILEYSHIGLTDDLNRKWALLDTFDMYSPKHDHPQTLKTVKRWFVESGFIDIKVQKGPNGIIGKGKKVV